MNIISADFNLGLHDKTIDTASMGYVGVATTKVHHEDDKGSTLRIKRREWNNGIDRKYWGQYGLNRAILTHFNFTKGKLPM